MKGLTPRFDAQTGQILFDLQRNSDNQADWAAILGSPDISGLHTVSLGVGLGDNAPQSEAAIKLTVFTWTEVLIWAAIAALMTAIFFYLALTTGMLRDAGALEGQKRPWSLGRSQMAFWTMIVFLAWMFLYLVTRDYNVVTASALGLMGISAATALGAVAVDASKSAGVASQVSSTMAEQVQLAAVAGVAPATALETAATARMAANRSKLAALTEPRESKGASNDLLGPDVRFHRLQVVLWTLGLGVAFVVEVWRTLAMPEFNSTLLALMGISAAGYVGFKFPEAPKAGS
jgi:hypothetical protein